ncbi:DNA polymerase IV [Bacillaceae bacterium JMAK1]|nr:DNA polymerase IV [Bacillaceae bacterium JMAK1]
MSSDLQFPEPYKNVSRKIIHVDMDAFFSSVEERDNPSLKGKPVIIAKHPRKTGGKGIVATANYEARKFGIHSAMSAYEAYERCPEGIFIEGNYPAYKEASEQILQIMRKITDFVEPMSIDEAYLDVTNNKLQIDSATVVAKHLQRQIYNETRLTSSAGVSYNKFIAKIASDQNKPAGLTVIPPEKAIDFLRELPIEKFHGIGPKTTFRMHELGIYRGEDLYQLDQMELVRNFGKAGMSYYRKIRGIDNKPLSLTRNRKSVGKEHTYFSNLFSEDEVKRELMRLSKEVQAALERHGKKGKTVVLKVRYHSFETLTRRISSDTDLQSADTIYQLGQKLYDEIGETDQGIRLLGLTVSNITEIEHEQMKLF